MKIVQQRDSIWLTQTPDPAQDVIIFCTPDVSAWLSGMS
ncbi:hypothetical protein UCMB321_0975 [Pseudomonas batumici]|uniref:Uncharacterized protein n=1 Tax=Pseudomonas batumici TaxID=226910 RepID=A0A0C2I813_9PSED|nr:hypothetical protein UCMB321_0975 [Pseudomonas batumici]